jgi:hypothetical protein
LPVTEIDQTKAPVEVLREFWIAMCEWERKAYKSYRASKLAILDVAPFVEERQAIIARFCTPKERVYSQPFSCGNPTEYDPENEDVLDVVQETPRRFAIHTQQKAGFQLRRKFIMLLQGDSWSLDNWQRLSNGKWKRGII